MLDAYLRNALLKTLKPTRRLVLQPGDPGQSPVTKVGGVPWWPASLARPHCPHGHAMSFIAQFRLDEVPELGPDDPGLLSFHYCQECSYEGRMPQGWTSPDSDWADPQDAQRYDLSIFTEFTDKPADGLGIQAEDVLSPYTVSFSERMETPSWDDARIMPELSHLIDMADEDDIDFLLQDSYDFDEDQFPELVHLPVSKLGGWPSWIQSPEWPRDYPDEQLMFVAQLSPLSDSETWCNGLAYLFIHPASQEDRKAKLLLQCT